MADDVFHQIDPNGDLVLILRNHKAPFAVWNVAKRPKSLARKNILDSEAFSPIEPLSPGLPSVTNASDLTSTDVTSWPWGELPQQVEVEPPAKPEIRYLVSSRHLTLASPKFETELKGPWMEGSVRNIDGRYHIEASEWDPAALLILMRVFHGQTRSVPRQICLDMLAKIAVLVDYYDSPEVIEVFTNIWIGELKDKLPTQYGRNMILWLLISHVFQKKGIFFQMTKIAATQSKEPVPTLELPIPSIVTDIIDWQRQEAVEYMLKTLSNLLEAFRTGSSGCSFECSSMLLGALTKEMDVHKLLNPPPKEPYIGYSIVDTKKMLNGFRCPQWNHPRRSHHSYYSETPDPCNLKTIISTRLTAQPNGVEGGFKISEIQTMAQKRSLKVKDKEKA
ncbi:hypothetical protein C8035_v007586 [Colletotrichum spinosum]|uniref:BTB domain-containing protein n=1 Tax=Colletotrichum spinosum TaxID=1347390 RepID=A0A4V3HQN9_9PEZI|nr:hypothetical protein C8035_v007586 [Colletotrichum spinosum]